MKYLKLIAPLVLLSISLPPCNADTPRKVVSRHLSVHSEQLAKHNSLMEQNTINEILKRDLIEREIPGNSAKTISSESSAMLSDLILEARRHIGKPYSRGSKGPRAFDCSGFSSYVYSQFGIKLGASSRDQYLQGEPIDKNNLQEGDLVFFTGRRSGGPIGHVGIVVSANNETGDFRFIHASNTSGICVTSSGGYFSGRYVGARRIITE